MWCITPNQTTSSVRVVRTPVTRLSIVRAATLIPASRALFHRVFRRRVERHDERAHAPASDHLQDGARFSGPGRRGDHRARGCREPMHKGAMRSVDFRPPRLAQHADRSVARRGALRDGRIVPCRQRPPSPEEVVELAARGFVDLCQQTDMHALSVDIDA